MTTRPELDIAVELLQFNLRGVDGEHHSLSSLAGSVATVVVFIANGCPTVRAYEERLMTLQEARRPDGVQLVAINSNNPHLSPPDTFTEMVKRSAERRFNFPYLKDEDGAVAKRYEAICTPHAFVLDRHLRITYSGRIDDSRVGSTATHPDLGNAVADLVAGRPVAVPHTDPFGCSIVL